MNRKVIGVALVLVLLVGLVAVSSPPAAEAVMPPFAVQRMALYPRLVDQENSAHFGRAVAVDGDVIAVGAPDDDGGKGAVYVFERLGTTWTDAYKISPTALVAGDHFGSSVDVSDGRIAIGAPGADDLGSTDAGTVWVYTKSGSSWIPQGGGPIYWMFRQPGAEFGQAVGISGDWLIVGAPAYDSTYADQGVVAFFKWDGIAWSWLTTLYGLSANAGDRLGACVDIDAPSGFAVASAPGDDDGAFTDCGAVTAFRYIDPNWSTSQRLVAPDRENSAAFGDVAISSGRLVIGAPNKDVGGQADAGEAYLFLQDGWTWSYDQSLYPPTPHANDYFGCSVACEDDVILVGAFFASSYHGEVYPYTLAYGAITAWPALAASGTGVTQLGTDVALSEGTLVAGAQMSSSPDTALCGAAYAFSSRGLVTGVVRDAETGEGLAGKEVSAFYPGAPDEPDIQGLVFTDASGAYSLPLDTGMYVICVMDPVDDYYYQYYSGTQSFPAATSVLVTATGTTPGIDVSLVRKMAPVYRFFNLKSGTHFYTDSFAEKQHVIATWPTVFSYEGVAYFTNRTADTMPLYRFYNKTNGSHFYTASADERDHVIATWPNIYSFDGPTYAVSVAGGAGKSPVYRFYNVRNGSHFYTASESERDHVIATWPTVFHYEGPAFWISGK